MNVFQGMNTFLFVGSITGWFEDLIHMLFGAERIIGMIEGMQEAINSVGTRYLTMSLSEFNSGIFNAMVRIANNVSMPIAISLLSLFILLEFFQMTQRTDLHGLSGVELPMKIIFKIALCTAIVSGAVPFLIMIFDITGDMISSINLGLTGDNILSISDIEEQIDNMNVGDLLLVWLTTFLIFICTWLAVTWVNVKVHIRMLEIYMYIAFAPIPLATLPSSDQSNIAKGFLKNFTAVCVQGVVMFIFLQMFQGLMGSLDFSGDGGMWGQLIRFSGYSIILVMAINGSERLSKAIIVGI